METLPEFYNPHHIGTLFYPDTANIATSAAASDLPSANLDQRKIHLLIVDMQIDFCHPSGSLYVPGATGDLQRLIEFIYRQAEHITDITCSLDSHLPYQIFHPAWWVDSHGNHPPLFTTITYEDTLNKKWLPLLEPEWSIEYTRRLREKARKELTIWPYHCLIGNVGHSLDPELYSAVIWHTLARHSRLTWWTKGSIPETEHYSIVQPEIPVPGYTQGTRSRDLIDLLKASDYIYIAGEAESHCVLETVEDLVEEFSDTPETLQHIYVLQDCTSPIRHPEIDYETITHRRFARFADMGVHFVNSQDAIPL